MATTTTKLDRLSAHLSTFGFRATKVRLTGDPLDTVTISEDFDWVEDGEGYRYTIDCLESTNETDDLEEAVTMAAEMARSLRNGEMDERIERDNESARDFVEGLIDAGKACDVLRVLRAAGLI